MDLSWARSSPALAARFLPVWLALVVTFALSIRFKRGSALYGKLFDSPSA
jgi:peptide/nickel transport system permease protein